MKNRNTVLDICKMIAMTFIVIGHVLQRSTANYTSNWISTLMLYLGLPIFFLVSGIAINYRKPLSPLGFVYDVIKRAIMYMWPVVLFLILRVKFFNQWESFEKAFSDFIDYPGWGLWVLWLIVWYNAFIDVGLLVSFLLPKWKKIIVSITLVIAFTIFVLLRQNNTIPNYHFIGYDYFVIYTPVFFVGYLLGDKIFTYFNKWVSIILLVAGLAGIIIFSRFVTPHYSSGYHIEENLYLFYLGSLMVVAFYYGISTLLTRVKVGEVIGFMGQFSLESYFLHLVVIKYWGRFDLGNPWLTVIASIALVVLLFGNTILIVVGTYFLPFTHFLLFGRHFSYYSFENKAFDKLKETATKDYFHKSSNNINNITQ